MKAPRQATETLVLRPARLRDADAIAYLSRALIEHGLPRWSWTPRRVRHSLKQRDTAGVVAELDGRMVGFGLMKVGEEHAHLNLLAVRQSHRRQGVGQLLVEWLETTVRVAGAVWIFLEVRACNPSAQRFYQVLGYQELERVRGYYCGRETAVRMGKSLVSLDKVCRPPAELFGFR